MGNEYMQPAHILLQWLIRKMDPKNAQKFLSEIENTQKNNSTHFDIGHKLNELIIKI